jgi:hypothetical protein
MLVTDRQGGKADSMGAPNIARAACAVYASFFGDLLKNWPETHDL